LKPFLRGRDVNVGELTLQTTTLIKIESSENKNHPWSAKSERESEKVFARLIPQFTPTLKTIGPALKNR